MTSPFFTLLFGMASLTETIIMSPTLAYRRRDPPRTLIQYNFFAPELSATSNFVKRHTRPGGQTRHGGIIEKEAPIHWSNVMLLCNKCMEPIRVKKKRLEDGKKVRVCGKCGEIIDT